MRGECGERALPDRCRPTEHAGRLEAGLGLLELVIGVSIGGLMVMAVAGSLSGAMGAARSARTTVQSTLLASERLEEARALGWGYALAHAPGSVDLAPEVVDGRFDPDGDGPLPAEEVVIHAEGRLSGYERTETHQGIVFTTKVFLTRASAATRVTAVVAWMEQGRSRRTRLGTLLHPSPTVVVGGSPTGGTSLAAMAYVLSGSVPSTGGEMTLASVRAPPDGEQTLASFAPAVEVHGSGARSEARAGGGIDRARTEISSLSVTLPGLALAGSGIWVEARSASVGAAPVMTASGTVTVNGTAYVDPEPNTALTAGTWRVLLNGRHAEPDGSASMTYVRVTGPVAELSLAYAWARPA